MNKPIHTPGPAQLPTGFESVPGDEHDGLPLFSNGDPFDTIAIVLPRTECNANARLLAASYNAFDSAALKLGCNAVECAERLAAGGIAELVESLEDILSRFRSCIGIGGEIEGDKEAIERTQSILAKVKGAAT